MDKSVKWKSFPCMVMKAVLPAALALLSLSSPASQAKEKALKVKTNQGIVQGKREGPVRAFLGIPYAAPPVEGLRWRPPMPPQRWNGVRPAAEFGYHCMQPTIYGDMIFRDPGISEDCLTLNIWTPANGNGGARDKNAKLPVMVWIYGGGHLAGGTSEPRQDGAQLATNGVVVVSMNYRLGIFGFFAHPGLSAESRSNASGNYGLMDQAAALAWVKENIAAFGGDPGLVTVFGESAGSASVSALMASPLAQGLFERAIGESGAAILTPDRGLPDRTVAEQRGAAFAREMLAMDSVDLMRAIPAEELLKESEKKNSRGETVRFGIDIDGYFLPESVAAVFAAGKQNDVPLLAGWNRDEGGVDRKVTLASFQADVAAKFGDRAAEVLKLYPAGEDAEAVRAAADLAGDRFAGYRTWRWMEAQAATGRQPVYRFRFDLAPPSDPNHIQGDVVYHSGEIPYVFGTLDLLQGFAWRPEDRKLSRQMQRYWTNFAKSGDPNGDSSGDANGDGLVKWPVYNAATGWQVMHLKPSLLVEPDANRARELLLDSIWGK